MVLGVFHKCIRLVFLLLLLLFVTSASAYFGPAKPKITYFHPIENDSSLMRWEMYQKALEYKKCKCPINYYALLNYVNELPEKQGVKFYNDFETAFRHLEISDELFRMSFYREKNLDFEEKLHLADMNIAITGIYLNLKFGFKLKPCTQSEYTAYKDMFNRYNIVYLLHKAAYHIDNGEYDEAEEICNQTVSISMDYPEYNEDIDKFSKCISFLKSRLPKNPELAYAKLKEIFPSDFTVDEVLYNGSLPFFYIAALQTALCYEKRSVNKALAICDMIIDDIRRNLSPSFPYMILEDKWSVIYIFKYYIDEINELLCRHVKKKQARVTLIEQYLLMEVLDLTKPVYDMDKMDTFNRDKFFCLQDSIDAIYQSHDYFFSNSGDSCFKKAYCEHKMVELKRRQIQVARDAVCDTVSLMRYEDIKQLLQKDDVLIKFMAFSEDILKEKYIAFILKSDSDAPELLKLKSFSYFDIYDDDKFVPGIWKSLKRIVGRDKNNLYICGDGYFFTFSWASVCENGKYLVEEYNIHNLFSLINFPNVKNKTGYDNSLNYHFYGFGGAYFTSVRSVQNRSLPGLQYLASSRNEVLKASKILPANWTKNVFLGFDADKRSFMNLSGSIQPNSILHVATHGFGFHFEEKLPERTIAYFDDLYSINFGCSSNEDPMMRLGILLAGANAYWGTVGNYEAENSGFITAKEIANMDLNNVDLAVLASCNSGNNYEEHDYNNSLQRAFRLAGVKDFIVSKSNIKDSRAYVFITCFYNNLLQSKTYFEAFVKTQRDLMKMPYCYWWDDFIYLE